MSVYIYLVEGGEEKNRVLQKKNKYCMYNREGMKCSSRKAKTLL